MRIGTWNLWLCPPSTSPRGQAISGWLDQQAVDVWLLTEVHRDWDRGRRLVVSPRRGVGPEEKRWAGIETALPLGALRTSPEPKHSGEEGLCLARLELGGFTASSVLVACSVLPWKGAGPYWPGLPSGQAAEFCHVLDHHVARIEEERVPGEPLIWGGDFNQQLLRPFWFTTEDGAAALRAAFDRLGLVAPTEQSRHLNGTSFAIDHLAVSPDLVAEDGPAAVHRPEWEGGQLSDHAAYTTEIRLSAPSRPPHAFASDVDGVRHVIVLADQADMDGWSIETSAGVCAFELDTVWGSDSPNFLGFGASTKAWIAVCDHGTELIRFVPAVEGRA
ncbi:endonuclease/exonuclease/phosphatase family protein [Geodermatophilus sp. SYSU D01036]